MSTDNLYMFKSNKLSGQLSPSRISKIQFNQVSSDNQFAATSSGYSTMQPKPTPQNKFSKWKQNINQSIHSQPEEHPNEKKKNGFGRFRETFDQLNTRRQNHIKTDSIPQESFEYDQHPVNYKSIMMIRPNQTIMTPDPRNKFLEHQRLSDNLQRDKQDAQKSTKYFIPPTDRIETHFPIQYERIRQYQSP